MEIRCRHGHVLVRFEVDGCDAGHEHRVHVCPLRRGSRRCGDVVVVPPYGPGCEEKDAR